MTGDLFVTGTPRGRIVCAACGRVFEKWQGTANHGLKHVGKGTAKASLYDNGRQIVYRFTVTRGTP